MSDQELRPSPEASAADWIEPRLRRFASGVSAVVPDGFPAYVRILHPAHGRSGTRDEHVRWATVAKWSARTMHRLAQFHAIASPAASEERGPAPWDGNSPDEGNLPIKLLRVLCAHLAAHTTTPASCWFCLWEGYGHLHGSPATASVTSVPKGMHAPPPRTVPPALPPEVLSGPKVRLPNRDYILFEGSLEAAAELSEPFGHRVGHMFFPQSPNLFWPDDHAWCVASEIDLFCTLVAGPEALIEALLADARLEAWRVEPGDPITYDSDLLNI